jgi:hypothetical protein
LEVEGGAIIVLQQELVNCEFLARMRAVLVGCRWSVLTKEKGKILREQVEVSRLRQSFETHRAVDAAESPDRSNPSAQMLKHITKSPRKIGDRIRNKFHLGIVRLL